MQKKKQTSTTVQCSEMFKQLNEMCLVPRPDNYFNFEASRKLELTKRKMAAKESFSSQFLDKFNVQPSELVMQGKFAQWLEEEVA